MLSTIEGLRSNKNYSTGPWKSAHCTEVSSIPLELDSSYISFSFVLCFEWFFYFTYILLGSKKFSGICQFYSLFRINFVVQTKSVQNLLHVFSVECSYNNRNCLKKVFYSKSTILRNHVLDAIDCILCLR